MSDEQNVLETALDYAGAHAKPVELDGYQPYAVIPKTYVIAPLDHLRNAPARIRSNITTDSLTAFIAYVNRFKKDGTLVTYQRSPGGIPSFLAILDYHQPGKPAWGEHRITLRPQPTKEFQSLLQINGHYRKQEEFATWLEEYARIVVDPPGADILELVQNLEARKDAEITSAMRLDNGQVQLKYVENIELRGKASVQGGLMTVPKVLTFALQPFFQDSGFYKLSARLRYRLSEHKVSFAVDLIELDKFLNDVTGEWRDTIVEEVGLIAQPLSL